jgi:hypothetical protein
MMMTVLWGGEMYYMQSDAHLRFVPKWDRLYIEEIIATQSYPKAILSSYPPGFNIDDPIPVVIVLVVDMVMGRRNTTINQ